jgi:prevent-host-death family protein
VGHHTTNHKGNIAEAAIAAAAIKLGIDVSKPLVEHSRYDLVFDVPPRLLRVQCKWAPKRGDVITVNLAAFRYAAHGGVRTTYSADEIDAVAAYCEELDRCYYLPVDMVAGMHAMSLRLVAPGNRQRAAIHWAADHELPGAIAQLGERWRGTPEVAGSSPASSTSSRNPLPAARIGAHELRDGFGTHLERVATGQELLVTRYGVPVVRMVPVQASLPVVAAEAAAPAGEGG